MSSPKSATTDAETKDLGNVRSYGKETQSPFNNRDVGQRVGREEYIQRTWMMSGIMDLIVFFVQPFPCHFSHSNAACL